jgi:hypothetical protein
MRNPFFRSTAAAVALVAAAACGSTDAGPRLEGGYRSMNSLVEHYLEAVEAGDTARMNAMRVTEYEHNELLWPSFPASRPEFNMPIDFAWQNLDRHSRRDAARVAHDYAGEDLTLLNISCHEGVTEYETFRVHGNCWLMLEEYPAEVKMLGSIVEMGGRFKLIGIVED